MFGVVAADLQSANPFQNRVLWGRFAQNLSKIVFKIFQNIKNIKFTLKK